MSQVGVGLFLRGLVVLAYQYYGIDMVIYNDNMKPINHPSGEYMNYNRVLQFLDFPVSLGFAVENLWITALMIAYQTPNILDCFIWILPNIIAILIRPTIITYVHKVFSSRQAQLALVSHFLFGGTLGCCLVGLSSQYFEDFYRIIVCVVGWTMMDVCFEMALFFGGKTKQRLSKLGYHQIQDDSNRSSFFGEVSAYLLSFLICYLKNGKTLKKFYTNSSYLYFIAATVSGLYWFLLYFVSYDRHTLSSQAQPISSPNRDAGYYLPGYYEMRRSSGFDRWLLTLHFCFLYIVDTLLIYGSMWIVMVYEELGEKQGVAYNHGMKQGALVLLVFTVFTELNVGKYLANKLKIQGKSLLKLFIGLLLLICILGALLFFKTQHEAIFLISALIGTANGLYSNNIQSYLTEKYPVYEACTEIIERFQKIFILCPMPFFVMMVLDRNDISDCLLSLPIMLVLLLLLGWVWRDLQSDVVKSSKKQKIPKNL